MSNKSDTDAIGKLTENEVEWKPVQVGAAKSRFDEMKSARRGSSQSNHSLQLHPKLIAQSLGNRVIKT